MTCRTTSLNWLDCLYNAVRKTPGGVNAADQWLTDRRGKSIHPETLRAKVNGSEGESVTIETVELLKEWIKKHAGGAEYALEWLQALAAQHGMAVDVVAPAGGWADEIGALQTKLLEITSRVGRLSGTAVHAMADHRLRRHENHRADGDHRHEAGCTVGPPVQRARYQGI